MILKYVRYEDDTVVVFPEDVSVADVRIMRHGLKSSAGAFAVTEGRPKIITAIGGLPTRAGDHLILDKMWEDG